LLGRQSAPLDSVELDLFQPSLDGRPNPAQIIFNNINKKTKKKFKHPFKNL
jgi:hypothetical protein